MDDSALGFWKNGYTLRTSNYRLTKYKEGSTIHTVLYDHSKDGNEATNVAEQAEYATILKELEGKCQELMPATYWASL